MGAFTILPLKCSPPRLLANNLVRDQQPSLLHLMVMMIIMVVELLEDQWLPTIVLQLLSIMSVPRPNSVWENQSRTLTGRQMLCHDDGAKISHHNQMLVKCMCIRITLSRPVWNVSNQASPIPKPSAAAAGGPLTTTAAEKTTKNLKAQEVVSTSRFTRFFAWQLIHYNVQNR